MAYPFKQVLQAHETYLKVGKAIGGLLWLGSLVVAQVASGQWQITVIVALIWIVLLQSLALVLMDHELKKARNSIKGLEKKKEDEPARINRERRERLDGFWNRANLLQFEIRQALKPSGAQIQAVGNLTNECYQYADEHLPPGNKNHLQKPFSQMEVNEASSSCGMNENRYWLMELARFTKRIEETLNKLPQN